MNKCKNWRLFYAIQQISDHRLHVHGDAQLDGKMFVMFLGLIMARLLRQRLQTHIAKKNETLHDMIRELKKIKFFKTKRGKWEAKNSLTKIQKELIAALNLEFLKEERLEPHPRVRPNRKKKA